MGLGRELLFVMATTTEDRKKEIGAEQSLKPTARSDGGRLTSLLNLGHAVRRRNGKLLPSLKAKEAVFVV